jgi:hypothetical protein
MLVHAEVALLCACDVAGHTSSEVQQLSCSRHCYRPGAHLLALMDDFYKFLQLLISDGRCNRRCCCEARWSPHGAAAVAAILVRSLAVVHRKQLLYCRDCVVLCQQPPICGDPVGLIPPTCRAMRICVKGLFTAACRLLGCVHLSEILECMFRNEIW